VLSDELLARFHGVELVAIGAILLGAGTLRVHVAGPVTAEVGVEDEALVLETLLDVASRAGELGGGFTEFTGIGVGGVETARNHLAAGKEPHLNDIAVPFHDIVSAPEGTTEGTGADLVDIAASRSARTIESAIKTCGRSSHALTIDFALGVGVQNVLVLVAVVDALDDVDLSLHGPRLLSK